MLPTTTNECDMHSVLSPLHRISSDSIKELAPTSSLKGRTNPYTIDGSVASYQYRHIGGNKPATNLATRPIQCWAAYLECWVIGLQACLSYKNLHILYVQSVKFCQYRIVTLQTKAYPSISVRGYTAAEESKRCTFSRFATPIS